MKITYFIIILLLSACDENLIRLKSEVEANRILLCLRDSGIDATKRLETTEWLIKVKKSQFTKALDVLERKRLYNRIDTGERLESSSNDIFATKAEKNSQLLEKVSRDLSLTMLMFPGVVDAKVHIFKEEEDILTGNAKRNSASVVIITDGSSTIDHQQVMLMVAKSSGVPMDSVAVIVQSVSVLPTEKATNASIVSLDKSINNLAFLKKLDDYSPIRINTILVATIILSALLFMLKQIHRAIRNKNEMKIISKMVE